MSSFGWLFILGGFFILMEALIIVTGPHNTQPHRIVWWNGDTVYQTESVPFGIDPHQYAHQAMRTDSNKTDYYILTGG